MIKVKDLLVYARNYVCSSQAEALLANLLNINSFELFAIKDTYVTNQIVSLFKEGIIKIRKTKKVTPVLSHVNSCDLSFIIADDVLLPHFETMEMVQETKNIWNHYFKWTMVD